jgi:hypothetical protein
MATLTAARLRDLPASLKSAMMRRVQSSSRSPCGVKLEARAAANDQIS